MNVTERDLDQVLARIGEEIDRFRTDRGPVAPLELALRGGTSAGRSRSWRALAGATAAAAVLIAAATWGLATFGRDSRDGTAGSPGASAPVTAPGLLTPIVEPLLPDGFVVVRETTSMPFVVTALRPDGVRLDVGVALDQAAQLGPSDGGGTLVSTATGEMSADGSTVITDTGDVVWANVFYGDQFVTGDDPALDFASSAATDSAAIAQRVAGALGQDLRAQLLALAATPNDLGASRLRADLQAALEAATGDAVSSTETADPGRLLISVRATDGSTVTLTGIRSSTPVQTSTVRPNAHAVGSTEVVNGWIVQLTDFDPSTAPSVMGDADIDHVLGAVRPLFENWVNESPAQAGCSTYTVVMGDSIASIVAQHEVSMESMYEVNADLEAVMLVGVTINLPCPISDNSAGPTSVVPEPTQYSVDDTGLPYLDFDPPPEGYTFSEANSFTSGKDFEPPALLLAWDRGDGAYTPITVGISDPALPTDPPRDADVIDTDTVTGWVWHSTGITSAYLQAITGPGYRIWATAETIPDDVLVDLTDALDPDGSLTWRGAITDSIIELGRQVNDAAIHAASYTNGDNTVSVVASTDFPFNGLTLEPDATVIPDIAGLGVTGFALRNPPTEEGLDLVVYWDTEPGPVIAIQGRGTDLDLDDLVTFADRIHPATPDQETLFVGI